MNELTHPQQKQLKSVLEKKTDVLKYYKYKIDMELARRIKEDKIPYYLS